MRTTSTGDSTTSLTSNTPSGAGSSRKSHDSTGESAKVADSSSASDESYDSRAIVEEAARDRGVETEENSDGNSPIGGANLPPAWQLAPPMSRTTERTMGTMDKSFEQSLTWRDPRVGSGGLGHLVDLDGPQGSVEGMTVLSGLPKEGSEGSGVTDQQGMSWLPELPVVPLQRNASVGGNGKGISHTLAAALHGASQGKARSEVSDLPPSSGYRHPEGASSSLASAGEDDVSLVGADTGAPQGPDTGAGELSLQAIQNDAGDASLPEPSAGEASPILGDVSIDLVSAREIRDGTHDNGRTDRLSSPEESDLRVAPAPRGASSVTPPEPSPPVQRSVTPPEPSPPVQNGEAVQSGPKSSSAMSAPTLGGAPIELVSTNELGEDEHQDGPTGLPISPGEPVLHVALAPRKANSTKAQGPAISLQRSIEPGPSPTILRDVAEPEGHGISEGRAEAGSPADPAPQERGEAIDTDLSAKEARPLVDSAVTGEDVRHEEPVVHSDPDLPESRQDPTGAVGGADEIAPTLGREPVELLTAREIGEENHEGGPIDHPMPSGESDLTVVSTQRGAGSLNASGPAGTIQRLIEPGPTPVLVRRADTELQVPVAPEGVAGTPARSSAEESRSVPLVSQVSDPAVHEASPMHHPVETEFDPAIFQRSTEPESTRSPVVQRSTEPESFPVELEPPEGDAAETRGIAAAEGTAGEIPGREASAEESAPTLGVTPIELASARGVGDDSGEDGLTSSTFLPVDPDLPVASNPRGGPGAGSSNTSGLASSLQRSIDSDSSATRALQRDKGAAEASKAPAVNDAAADKDTPGPAPKESAPTLGVDSIELASATSLGVPEHEARSTAQASSAEEPDLPVASIPRGVQGLGAETGSGSGSSVQRSAEPEPIPSPAVQREVEAPAALDDPAVQRKSAAKTDVEIPDSAPDAPELIAPTLGTGSMEVIATGKGPERTLGAGALEQGGIDSAFDVASLARESREVSAGTARTEEFASGFSPVAPRHGVSPSLLVQRAHDGFPEPSRAELTRAPSNGLPHLDFSPPAGPGSSQPRGRAASEAPLVGAGIQEAAVTETAENRGGERGIPYPVGGGGLPVPIQRRSERPLIGGIARQPGLGEPVSVETLAHVLDQAPIEAGPRAVPQEVPMVQRSVPQTARSRPIEPATDWELAGSPTDFADLPRGSVDHGWEREPLAIDRIERGLLGQGTPDRLAPAFPEKGGVPIETSAEVSTATPLQRAAGGINAATPLQRAAGAATERSALAAITHAAPVQRSAAWVPGTPGGISRSALPAGAGSAAFAGEAPPAGAYGDGYGALPVRIAESGRPASFSVEPEMVQRSEESGASAFAASTPSDFTFSRPHSPAAEQAVQRMPSEPVSSGVPAGSSPPQPPSRREETVFELVDRIYPYVSSRIKEELRLDRERAGLLTPFHR